MPSFQYEQRVVKYCLRNKSNVSFQFVGDLFQMKRGHAAVKQWCDRYDVTITSLEQRYCSE